MSAAVPCQGIGLLYGTADTHRRRQRRGRIDLFSVRLPLVRSVRKLYIFALYRTAGTVFFDERIFAGTAIAGIQRSMTFGEYIINIFFTVHGAPIRSGICQNHHISPEKVLYFRFDIVVAVGANDADIMPKVAQCAIRDFGQGVVQLTIGVGEFFAPLIIRMLLIFLTSR